MADKAWKRVEREKCRALGGERTGPRGFGLPDCVGIKIALEVKHLKRFVFLKKHWEQAVENAERVGLPPVLAVKETGRNGRDCVQLDRDVWASLLDLHGSSSSAYYTSTLSEELLRVPWSTFVHVYRGAYINNEEN